MPRHSIELAGAAILGASVQPLLTEVIKNDAAPSWANSLPVQFRSARTLATVGLGVALAGTGLAGAYGKGPLKHSKYNDHLIIAGAAALAAGAYTAFGVGTPTAKVVLGTPSGTPGMLSPQAVYGNPFMRPMAVGGSSPRKFQETTVSSPVRTSGMLGSRGSQQGFQTRSKTRFAGTSD